MEAFRVACDQSVGGEFGRKKRVGSEQRESRGWNWAIREIEPLLLFGRFGVTFGLLVHWGSGLAALVQILTVSCRARRQTSKCKTIRSVRLRTRICRLASINKNNCNAQRLGQIKSAKGHWRYLMGNANESAAMLISGQLAWFTSFHLFISKRKSGRPTLEWAKNECEFVSAMCFNLKINTEKEICARTEFRLLLREGEKFRAIRSLGPPENGSINTNLDENIFKLP